jgi:hypothetical protein
MNIDSPVRDADDKGSRYHWMTAQHDLHRKSTLASADTDGS